VLIDEIVVRLAGEGVDTVLNLAAGLDSRPYRLPLPSTLRWIEMDLPGITSAKQELLAQDQPRCRVERVALDLSQPGERQRGLSQFAGKMSKALVITEGLLIYLNPAVVAELARDLYQQGAIQYWLLDIASPLVARRMRRWWKKHLKAANTALDFAPTEGSQFFAPLGWHEAEFHDLLMNAFRINRPMPMAWMIKAQMRLFPKRSAKQMALWRSGVALLNRT
jgi:O-methyltransferase involved in polyketide biosynthesis